MGKESITLSVELAKTQCHEIEYFEDNYSLTISTRGCWINTTSLIPKEHSLYRALKHSIRQHKLDLNSSKTKASANSNKISLKLQISYDFLVNTELENRPSLHLTKHSTPARRKKLSSSNELAWNLCYTV